MNLTEIALRYLTSLNLNLNLNLSYRTVVSVILNDNRETKHDTSAVCRLYAEMSIFVSVVNECFFSNQNVFLNH